MLVLPSWATNLLRGPHKQWGAIRASYRGAILQLEDSGGLAYRDRTLLPLRAGDVQIDGGTPGARRTLGATFAPQAGLWDLLATPGVELRPVTVLQGTGGERLEIPQGVFPIDVLRMTYGPTGQVQVSDCPDRWSLIKAGRFFTPRQAPAGTNSRSVIASLLTEVLPAGTSVIDTSTSNTGVPAGDWDRDRDKTIENLATAASVDVFFDRNGVPTIRDVPTLAGAPVWLVDASASGVLLGASRERSRQKTFNVVIVSSSRMDGTPLFDPVVVWDNDPSSPTYAGPDPINHPELAGPFGVRSTFWSSPLLVNADQARAAALTILERVRGLAAQLSLTASPHPGLEDGDVLSVQLPRERADLRRAVELHLIDQVSIPLRPSGGGVQDIGTRSTRPDTVSES